MVSDLTLRKVGFQPRRDANAMLLGCCRPAHPGGDSGAQGEAAADGAGGQREGGRAESHRCQGGGVCQNRQGGERNVRNQLSGAGVWSERWRLRRNRCAQLRVFALHRVTGGQNVRKVTSLSFWPRIFELLALTLPGQGTAAARAALPVAISVRNIFCVHTVVWLSALWDFNCVAVYGIFNVHPNAQYSLT